MAIWEIGRRVSGLVRTVKAKRVENTEAELFESYAKRWLARRVKAGLKSELDYESTLRLYLLPAFGASQIGDIATRDVREFMSQLRSTDLAPNTMLNIYSVLRSLMGDAETYEVIPKSPCILRKNDLPKSGPRDPEFRKKAIFTKAEIVRLLDLDGRVGLVPLEWLDLYRAVFFTGGRIGEILALTPARIDLERKPLGMVTIAKSWSTKNKKLGTTKTAVAREVPVHPQWDPHLRRLLANKQPDELLFPALRKGGHMRSTVVRHRLADDLEELGLRDRRTHDLRRTFVSLAAQCEGAKRDVLMRFTHARKSEVWDSYRETSWDEMCRELSRLSIE